MWSIKLVFVFGVAVFVSGTNCGVLPAVPAAVPLAAPAPVAYHHAIPYNVPPYADRLDIQTKVLNVPAVPAIPAVASYAAAPFPAPYPAPYAFPHPIPLPYDNHLAVPAPIAPTLPAVAGPVAPALPFQHTAYAAPFYRK